ncbi:MAG: phenylalanine--tRNA ligase subunit alpha [Omnitrophica WOR_2 bacterium RIFCSPHIGHO2_01_FULL_48_9]|nr:MAG: phenylalanine--tRNA ligase subunit alpha [Omnitrophica WOR_2 bacterium RIFCSPHIGHO2_01_FULL_48_9]
MAWDFEAIAKQIDEEIKTVSDSKSLEFFRIKYLGKKGLIAEMYSALSSLSAEEKPTVGKNANILKNRVTQLIEDKNQEIAGLQRNQSSKDSLDITMPGVATPIGHRHVLTQTMDEICSLFEKLGFVVQEGPEIESEFNNFTALNIPIDHPSRDAFDTFYLEEHDPHKNDRYLLLRSHTSPGQIRIMQEHKPPLAVVIPGKVYRPDAVDASHSFMFHQIEGLLVDEDVKFSDLKGLLTVFCKKFFNEKIKMRFRPHFFPFTEPSAEVDISCYKCAGKGCSVCGRKGWLEIMGCGMVNPKVFDAVGYPKGKYTGLAFGMGVERIAMLKYGIPDIRIFFENDVRFLRQF